jgi:hypothetical protein
MLPCSLGLVGWISLKLVFYNLFFKKVKLIEMLSADIYNVE